VTYSANYGLMKLSMHHYITVLGLQRILSPTKIGLYTYKMLNSQYSFFHFKWII